MYSISRKESARTGRRRGFIMLLKITWIPSVRRSETLLSKVVASVRSVWWTLFAEVGFANIPRRWSVASTSDWVGVDSVVGGRGVLEPVLFCTIRRI